MSVSFQVNLLRGKAPYRPLGGCTTGDTRVGCRLLTGDTRVGCRCIDGI